MGTQKTGGNQFKSASFPEFGLRCERFKVHSGDEEESRVECYAVSTGQLLLTFRRNLSWTA